MLLAIVSPAIYRTAETAVTLLSNRLTIVDGFQGQGLLLEFGRLGVEQFGETRPELFDLLWRRDKPYRVQQLEL